MHKQFSVAWISILYLLISTTLFGQTSFTPNCDPNGNWILFANYDGGNLNIVVDQNIPNLKIGICTYEPVNVTFSGPFVNTVTEVLYAGFNSAQNNNNCGFPISTSSFNGINPAILTVNVAPPVTIISPPNPNYFNIPNGWNNGIICLYSCNVDANQGGCNTVDQVLAYFQSQFGGVLRGLNVQYNCWDSNTPLTVSAQAGNCCGACVPDTVSLNQIVCNDQLPYVWNGLTFNGPGTQSVTLTNAAGCDSIVNLNLAVNQPSSNTINITSCGPYLAGDGQLYTQSTTFSYVIPNAVGCDSNITVNLTVVPVPSAAFSSNPELLEYGLTEVQMIDQSTGQIDTWSWTISSENGNIQSSSLQNPLFSLPNNLSGNITFQLTVSNNQGCTDNATSVLTILEDAAIYIPNAFSPDGNNLNNVFRVEGRNIDPEFFELSIYNRWGELIFLSKDLNVGWDGSVNTYGPAPIGVYTYKVSYRFNNQDDNQTITGHLNLLR